MERYQKHLSNSQNSVSFDTSAWRDCTFQKPYERSSLLGISRAHRNGFSKSLGDLSSPASLGRYQRRTVMFEDDMKTHAQMLDRARTRFRELELKYPEVFKTPSRSSSIYSMNTLRGSSMVKQPSIELSFHCCESENQPLDHDLEVKELDQLGDLNQVPVYRKLSGGQRRRAPLLSSSMRSHHLDDSCDSAFDEIDRESNHSHDQSPNYVNNATSSSRFLYPGDSLESDKDSGISTDQPFIPPARTSNFHKRATFVESETSQLSKSLSVSQPLLVSDSTSRYSNWRSTDQPASSRTTRQGILKSTAYRNQGIRSESFDAEFPLDRVRYRTKRSRLQALKTGSEVYRRSTTHIPSFLSHEDDYSDSETVHSVRSEVLIRPKISAQEQYLSTYGLDRISSDENISKNAGLYKSKSLPNLGYSQSSFDEATGFTGAVLSCDNPKKRKKRILQRFGRRSGLYVVNDVPPSEKPKLPFSPGNSWKKRRSKLKKSASLEPSHVNETTKVWYDHTTAVSRPSNGQILGRVLTLREDLGMAYEIELQRPHDGLFGFFIQKGYKECRKGVFISRIMNSSSSKFIAGLLNPGDELLEVNGQCTKAKTVTEVQNIMAHSDKLILTVLPYVSRKDW